MRTSHIFFMNHSTSVKRLVSSKAMKCFYFSKEKSQDHEAKTSKFDSISGSEFNSETSTTTSITSSLHVLSETHSNNLRVFALDDLKIATKNFSRSLMIGEGGFGGVFLGVIQSPQDSRKKIEIAVKQLSRRGLQGHKEWVTEVNVLGVVEHPNLVKLIGYCAEDDERGIQRLLVYEYVPNRSVQDHLSNRFIVTPLPWSTRLKIAQDTARGLAYLHQGMEFQIIFRDFKSSNILLDENWNAKLSDFGLARMGWKDCFSVIIGRDEVSQGKPSPDIFLEAARRLNKDPAECLVIEDSVPGVMAGKAAGTKVIAVPSLPKQTHLYTSADEVINSLLDIRPEKWGLPPFQDWIENTLPIDPWHIGGPVIKGFGRGSKVLGIPTANLSTKDYADELVEHPSGVYFGWAGLAERGVFKMVMSIGWNPYFNNTEKTIEPWLLHDFTEDFYGEELRLIIVGYIRPEANFPSLESLVAKIHEDREVAERALNLSLYAKFKDDPYLK